MIDLHATNQKEHMELDLNETPASITLNQPRAPFQVPMRILIPQDIDGFIAAEKNLSMTRQVSGALRVQPIMMGVGQAAGALAGLAVRYGVEPREIPPVRVQRALLDAGVTLSLIDYSDVSLRHNFYKAVQLATLHRLMEPAVPPSSSRTARGILRVLEVLGERGGFGVNKPVTRDEMVVMMNRARAASGASEGEIMAEGEGGAGFVTRAVFLESVLRVFGIEGDYVEVLSTLDIPELFRTNPGFNRPITRGEAAEILMRAMTEDAACLPRRTR